SRTPISATSRSTKGITARCRCISSTASCTRCRAPYPTSSEGKGRGTASPFFCSWVTRARGASSPSRPCRDLRRGGLACPAQARLDLVRIDLAQIARERFQTLHAEPENPDLFERRDRRRTLLFLERLAATREAGFLGLERHSLGFQRLCHI